MVKQTNQARHSRKRRGARRRGYTLVFFAMMLFGLMAMAALVIDIGFARLTQRQMQIAADAAALEGLRFRDVYPPEYATPMSLEEARRRQASNIVAWTFDDDFDPSNVDALTFGAGPRIDLGPGIDGGGTINAGQFISSPGNSNPNPQVGSLPDPPAYKPTRSDNTTRGLELNIANAIHGDMLAGSYVAENPSDPSDADWHDEQPSYSRNDFNSTAATHDAFLVRMRRLHDDFDAVDTEAGVSSKGPEIPYLFGRGAMLSIENPDGDYLPRIHGIAVRATAIADAQPVLSAGVALPDHNLPGSTAFCIFLGHAADGWIDIPAGTSVTLKIDSTGFVSWVTATGNTQIGYVMAANGESQVLSVGQPLVSTSPTPNENAYVDSVVDNAAIIGASRQIFVPIVGDNSGTTEYRSVGFGFALVDRGTNSNELIITKQQRRIAHENASAVVVRNVSSASVSDIFSDNHVLRDAGDSLLAPASAR